MIDIPRPPTPSSGPMPPGPGRPGYRPDIERPVERSDRHLGDLSLRSRIDPRPIGIGSVFAFFVALMVMFIIAAAVAQFAVRNDRQEAGTAPPPPPVTQDATPAKPSPPADGNPAGKASPDAVTP